jgi:hypothetical protein
MWGFEVGAQHNLPASRVKEMRCDTRAGEALSPLGSRLFAEMNRLHLPQGPETR